VSELVAVDSQVVEKLLALGGPEFARQMFDLFFQYAPEKIAQAHGAAAAGDWEGVEMAVHPLKSSAGHVGACRLQALARQIEGLARARQGETIPALLKELDDAYAQVKPLLEQIRQNMK